MVDLQKFPIELLIEWVTDAREKTFQLVEDLSDEQMMGPKLDIVNPLLWEIGHTAYFQEFWVLRRNSEDSLIPNADKIYDSIHIPHEARWELPLLPRKNIYQYLQDIRDKVLEILDKNKCSQEDIFHIVYSIFHEDMHTEAFTNTRQILGLSHPFHKKNISKFDIDNNTKYEDVEIIGGEYLIGSSKSASFVFDNEKWVHPVNIDTFSIASTPVTQKEFLNFVENGGYSDSNYWTDEGWKWRQKEKAAHPVYWEKGQNGKWNRRLFNQWIPLEHDHPVIHINWYEANAYCRWAGRRLPTEVEWEIASNCSESTSSNLDWQNGNTIPVNALLDSENNFGCRQMLGNVWEWTVTDFHPYPGFTPDPYDEYSQPLFHQTKVLRGGCWATRSRLIRNTYRNYYTPYRRDVFAGLRTCAL